jgi:hypothetical protein
MFHLSLTPEYQAKIQENNINESYAEKNPSSLKPPSKDNPQVIKIDQVFPYLKLKQPSP